MSILPFRSKRINGNSNLSADSRGFTLVEVLVSLSCMVIAFAFLFRLHFSSSVINSHNDLELRALTLCNQQMEYERSLGFSNIVVQSTSTYQKPFTIKTVVTQPYYWQMLITVSANWTEETGSSTHKTIGNSVVLQSAVVSFQ